MSFRQEGQCEHSWRRPHWGTPSSSTTTFSWRPGAGVSYYWLYMGSSIGRSDFHNSGQLSGSTTSRVVAGLPKDGRMVYARLWWYLGAGWNLADYTYRAASEGPTLQIDGGSSSTRRQGQTFAFSTTGFTPHGSTTRWLTLPSGERVVMSPMLSANSAGAIQWFFTATCSTAPGAYRVAAVDNATGRSSNTVTELVAVGDCGPTITSHTPGRSVGASDLHNSNQLSGSTLSRTNLRTPDQVRRWRLSTARRGTKRCPWPGTGGPR